MSEILSQEEIDKLLNAYSSGELDTTDLKEETTVDVKLYDFKRPSKFSKEHLRTLESIFEHYGRLLYTNLPAYFRKSVQVDKQFEIRHHRNEHWRLAHAGDSPG